MRILSFSQNWFNFETDQPKLKGAWFTTFRLPRKDRDWEQGETVQVYWRNRTKERKLLGIAEIILKEPRSFNDSTGIPCVSTFEARLDGFLGVPEMRAEFARMHGSAEIVFNRLTLRWLKQEMPNG